MVAGIGYLALSIQHVIYGSGYAWALHMP